MADIIGKAYELHCLEYLRKTYKEYNWNLGNNKMKLDKGIDITGLSKNGNIAVQCKYHSNKTINVSWNECSHLLACCFLLSINQAWVISTSEKCTKTFTKDKRCKFITLEFSIEQPEKSDAQLRDYQLEAYNLAQGKNCTICLPCGTGKTLIAAALSKEYKDVTFVTSSKTTRDNIKDFKKFGIIPKSYCYASMNKITTTDFLILDECHHLENEDNECRKWLQTIKATRILCLTATPNLNSSLYQLYPIVYNMPLYQAIELELIPKVITIYVKVETESLVDSNNFFLRSLSLYPVLNPIMFWFSRKQSKEWISKADISGFDIYHLDGETTNDEKNKIIERFRSPKCLITNVKILSEGVDLPNCDSIIFPLEKNSKVDIIQCIGRCLRKYPGKENVYIFVPLPVMSDETIINTESKSFLTVRKVICELNGIDIETIDTKEFDRKIGDRIHVLGLKGEKETTLDFKLALFESQPHKKLKIARNWIRSLMKNKDKLISVYRRIIEQNGKETMDIFNNPISWCKDHEIKMTWGKWLNVSPPDFTQKDQNVKNVLFEKKLQRILLKIIDNKNLLIEKWEKYYLDGKVDLFLNGVYYADLKLDNVRE